MFMSWFTPSAPTGLSKDWGLRKPVYGFEKSRDYPLFLFIIILSLHRRELTLAVLMALNNQQTTTNKIGETILM